MSIMNTIRIVERFQQLVIDLQAKHPGSTGAGLELEKLNTSIKQLKDYLERVDRLTVDFNHKDINEYMEAMKLHIDILKVELPDNEYSRLQQGFKAVKTILKFHPKRYSYVAFVAAWFLEWLYFI